MVGGEGAFDRVRLLLATVAESNQGSFLTVLKRFGDAPSPGLLSFPMRGATLALDFPNHGEETRTLVQRLNAMAVEAGGRIYPAKDALMTKDMFQAGYPAWRRVEALRDPAILSDFWRRTTGAVMSRRILILGAGSAMAHAYARVRAGQGASFVLAGRRREVLDANAADLKARGAAGTTVFEGDLGASALVPDLAGKLFAEGAFPDEVLIAYGSLPDQTAAAGDLALAREALDVNFDSPAAWLLALMQARPAGHPLRVAVIGSVAGDRGRKTNFIYGAAKAGLARLLEGLQHAHAGHGGAASPGQAGLRRHAHDGRHLESGGPLWATPDRVGADIARRSTRRGPWSTRPWFWRPDHADHPPPAPVRVPPAEDLMRPWPDKSRSPAPPGLVGQNLIPRLKARGYSTSSPSTSTRPTPRSCAGCIPTSTVIEADLAADDGWQDAVADADVLVIFATRRSAGSTRRRSPRNNITATRARARGRRARERPTRAHQSSSVVNSAGGRLVHRDQEGAGEARRWSRACRASCCARR